MGKNLLQRIVFPSCEEQECRDLFVRKAETECSAFGYKLCDLVEYKFDTWMNIFAEKKWFHYCKLSGLFLGFNIRGRFALEIVGINHNAAYLMIEEQLFYEEYVDQDEDYLRYIKVPDSEIYDAIYLRIITGKTQECTFSDIGWFTEDKPMRSNKIAISMCTYKREKYVYKTIDLFNHYFEEMPLLTDRLHLFISDNGNTLDLNKRNENVDIFYNINAGGAGGFGRGLLEACRSKQGYTRCIFMDDDVKIIPESFFRTLTFSDYLKEEYKDAVINGAMLELFNRRQFYENLAIQDGWWVRPYHYAGDLYDLATVLRVNEFNDSIWNNENKKVNAAWFYSCVDIDEKATLDDLPMPIFIRGDDVEYGWRNHGKPFIQLNGICVWHAPFYYRVSKVVDRYYYTRNMIIVHMLHTNGFDKEMPALLFKEFKRLLGIYDYTSIELMIRGINDALKGKKIFYEDPVALHKEVTSTYKDITSKEEDWYGLEAIRNKNYHYGKAVWLINRGVSVVFNVFPIFKVIVKRNTEKSVGEWFPPKDAFLYRKNVKVYNLYSGTFYYRNYSYKKERQLLLDFKRSIRELQKRYHELQSEYREAHKEVTSFNFWKRYLKLED